MAKVVHLADSLRPPRPGQGSAAEQADAWLAYLYSGAATDAGREQFSRWLRESPAHAAAYARAEKPWRELAGVAAALEDLPAAPTVTAAPAATMQSPSVAPRRRRHRRAFAVAAMLVVAVILGWWQVYDPAAARYTSDVGEIRNLTLADGSAVTLSGDSRIVARIDNAGERRVELVRGRAYFDVAPDPQRPFYVKVAATEIRVVGTAFDVNKSPEGVQVAVTHGLVEVRAAAKIKEQAKEQAPPARRIEAGQKLVAKLDGALATEVQTFDEGKELGWKSGHLHYVDTRLDTVIAEVNRYRTDKIVLADESLGAFRITASFKTDQTDQLLSGLEASYPVQVSRAGDDVVVRAR